MPYQRGIIELLNRGKECVHVHVDPGARQICSCPQLCYLAVHCPASTQQLEFLRFLGRKVSCQRIHRWHVAATPGFNSSSTEAKKAPYPCESRCVSGLHPVSTRSHAISCPVVTWVMSTHWNALPQYRNSICAQVCITPAPASSPRTIYMGL